MAAFVSTVVEKRENIGAVPTNSTPTFFTRTITYTIPAATASGSTCNIITIPAGVYIVDILDKASVTLANSSTIAYSLGAGSAIAPAAIRTASTTMAQIGTITKANAVCTVDTPLTVTTGVGTIDNASVVTVTLLCAVFDVATPGATTYTL